MAKSLETDVKNKEHDLRIQHFLYLFTEGLDFVPVTILDNSVSCVDVFKYMYNVFIKICCFVIFRILRSESVFSI